MSVSASSWAGASPTLGRGGADFTRVTPALSWHGTAAAVPFGGVHGFGDQTNTALKLGVAVVHTYICGIRKRGDTLLFQRR